MERYLQEERIGKGTYGTVFRARDTLKDNEYVALKTIQLEEEEGIPSTAIREIALLKFLKHPNIVALHDVIHMYDKLVMVFELLELDLKHYIDVCPQGLQVLTIKSLLYQLLQGLAHCHKQKVLHRDLKPANLLLNRAGILKVADFGLARSFAMHVSTLKYEVITLWYRAPELLLGAFDYGTEVDIWSVGCIFVEMINGAPLFNAPADDIQVETIFRTLGRPREEDGFRRFQFYEKYKEVLESPNIALHTPDAILSLVPRLSSDPDGQDLLKRLLALNPKDRISADEAMSHPFFGDLKRRSRRSSQANTGTSATPGSQIPRDQITLSSNNNATATGSAGGAGVYGNQPESTIGQQQSSHQQQQQSTQQPSGVSVQQASSQHPHHQQQQQQHLHGHHPQQQHPHPSHPHQQQHPHHQQQHPHQQPHPHQQQHPHQQPHSHHHRHRQPSGVSSQAPYGGYHMPQQQQQQQMYPGNPHYYQQPPNHPPYAPHPNAYHQPPPQPGAYYPPDYTGHPNPSYSQYPQHQYR